MPTPKQMEKLASEAARRQIVPAIAPDAALPAEYWDSLLRTPASGSTAPNCGSDRFRKSSGVLRVSCRRCERTVEIQTIDAIRLYGAKATWKQVGQRLLDDTCQNRTGSHEDDGCWPNFDA
jgi:hypothetical protein